MQFNNCSLSSEPIPGNAVMNEIKGGCIRRGNTSRESRGRKRSKGTEKGERRGRRERKRRNDEDKRKPCTWQAVLIGKTGPMTSGVSPTVWAEAEAIFFWPSL